MERTRKLFCEYGPVFYWLSIRKETLRRRVGDIGVPFCRTGEKTPMPVLVKGHTSQLLRPLPGVDMALQHGKVHNLALAAKGVNGLVIQPGEVFSFWRAVGKVDAKRGYRDGLTIARGRLAQDVGGGLCQLANLVHWLALHSPLTVVELHHHSDAVFPDVNRRVPFGTGTSVFYPGADYRLRNDTEQPVQLLVWLDEVNLCGELRAAKAYPWRYRIEEEGHHFAREGAEFYRNSQIYRRVIDRQSGETLRRELVLQNHSRVLYDHALIPAEQIR